MSPPSTWSLAKPMGAPPGKMYPSSVHALQRLHDRVPVDVVCGQHQLSTTGDFSAQFEIYTSPLQCYLEIRLNLKPRDPLNINFAYVRFLTYVDGEEAESRAVQPHTGQPNDTIPDGPFDFGRQIRELKHVSLSDSAFKDIVNVDKDIGMLHVYSWKAQDCVKIAFSRPTENSAAAQALERFKILIEHALSSGEAIHVITRKSSPGLIRRFRWLVSSPVPMPVSYWPWMRKLTSEDPVPEGEELMDFSRQTFELDQEWIDMALAVRDRDWMNQQAPLAISAPVIIRPFDEVLRFNDWRHYLAFVLGGHTYEYQESNSIAERCCNGTHTCGIKSDGSSRYFVLLNINPDVEGLDKPSSGTLATLESGEFLPEIGERVSIEIAIDPNQGERSKWSTSVAQMGSSQQ